MGDIDGWIARIGAVVALGVSVSKEIRAWKEQQKKRQHRPRKFK